MKKLLLYCLYFCALTSVHTASRAQTISTVAGTGTTGFMTGSYGGDNGAATAANLNNPCGVAFDAAGNMYVCDGFNHRVRMIDAAGIITTIAGTGTGGFSGDNGPATAAALSNPAALAFDIHGNLYVADQGNFRVRKIDHSGIITTVAGGPTSGLGDGGPATAAFLNNPLALLFDRKGNLYISDWLHDRIRKVDTFGMISTIAGTGSTTFSGDNGPATAAGLAPEGMLLTAEGSILVCDASNNRIRKIDTAGIITTLAGTGAAAATGDGGAATAAAFNFPGGLAYDHAGNIVVLDQNNHKLRQIDTAGYISTIAGTGSAGFAGDGGPAAAAQFQYPSAIIFDAHGSLYITDMYNNRVRKITYPYLDLSAKTTAIGTGVAVFPNPTGNILHIANLSGTTTYTVYSIAGKNMMEGQLTAPSATIIMENLPAGIYFLRLSGAGASISERIIKL